MENGLAIVGNSVGGNMTAVTALKAKEMEWAKHPLAGNVLAYCRC